MLLQFSVGNFRTFKEMATLSMIASFDKELEGQNSVNIDAPIDIRVLKSAVIYGANASGKTKLLEAMGFMRTFVINSSKDSQSGEEIDVQPFSRSVETEAAPSYFEAVFIHDRVLYRYGFLADKTKIHSEWLFERAKTKEINLFFRNEDQFENHTRRFTKGAIAVKQNLLRNNALVISLAAQFNDPTAKKVLDWFAKLKVLEAESEGSTYKGFTINQLAKPEFKAGILKLLEVADFDIKDVAPDLFDVDSMPQGLPKSVREAIMKRQAEEKKKKLQFVGDVQTFKDKYDEFGNVIGSVAFSLDEDESRGTEKFFSLTGPIIDSLNKGNVLVVDELDARLHPNLVSHIISLFNTESINVNGAQLIFNTHNSNLFSSKLFRRDQIWFVEKSKYGEAKLYSLGDFKSTEVRKGESFEDNYLRGKYGAIPYLNYFDDLTVSDLVHEDEK